MITKSSVLGVAFIAAATASTVLAQQPSAGQTFSGRATDGVRRARTATSEGRRDVTFYITECLVGGNKGEIALARIAEQRATDADVKKFAHQMIQDHTAFLSKLRGGQSASTQPDGTQPSRIQSAVGGPGVDINAPGARVQVPINERPNTEITAESDRGTNARAGAGARQFLQLQKEVESQCLQTKTRELNQKDGSQFDRCYMNGQVMAHMKMADELAVYSRSVPGDLQSVLQQGLQTTKQHLAEAKQIVERLEGTNRTASSRNRQPAGQ